MKIDVLLNPAEISRFAVSKEPRPEACVVFDILRATTSIVAAIDAGAATIRPVLEIEEAFDWKQRTPDVLLAGERHGDRIEGFDFGNSPSEFVGVAGRNIVMTTTNGTVALRACEGSPVILAAAFTNLAATTGAVRAANPASLAILCAGTFETTALEDVVAAGAFCDRLGEAALTDSARIALALWRASAQDPASVVRSSRNANALIRAGRERDIDAALRVDSVAKIAAMNGGVICPSGG